LEGSQGGKVREVTEKIGFQNFDPSFSERKDLVVFIGIISLKEGGLQMHWGLQSRSGVPC